MAVHLWVRHETRETERRTPLIPADARRLIELGFTVTIERSPQRIFAIEQYADAGAEIVDSGTWVDAPTDAYILGLKELPDEPAELAHRHIFFGHAYKGQEGAAELLERFRRGGGQLLDIEYLTDESGRRVVAFGYWAGYVGAALGVLQYADQLKAPLQPTDKNAIDTQLAEVATPPRTVVIGAYGRSGRGAVDALSVAGAEVTTWGIDDTRELDKPALLGHELLVNCVVSFAPQPPFVEAADLTADRALRVIADVTADVTSDANLLPINTAITTWDEPVRLINDTPLLEVIAIDNLPSLLPREASEDFSAALRPQLEVLETGAVTWTNTAESFARNI
ncbi:saccharopine dehydrogenase [Epidermidibacterium keratini]|uniref:Saccharopine dehydrogenase n=1 Tax=Epidermidibacterium keratini TaxID=1891644 RepID=A0A7L4YP60_9ACTN|nr:saccharopine dehydrogenase [Epidermidibacterium keratini]QHC00347.1 saccharopine dehydrogenase [Epidermidibacterium keratini]